MDSYGVGNIDKNKIGKLVLEAQLWKWTCCISQNLGESEDLVAIWVYMESGEWLRSSAPIITLTKTDACPRNREEVFSMKIQVVIEMLFRTTPYISRTAWANIPYCLCRIFYQLSRIGFTWEAYSSIPSQQTSCSSIQYAPSYLI